MTKIPNTRPSYLTSRYWIVMGDEHQGGFRQFRSAWTWREYLRTLHPAARLLIYDRGTLVSVSEPRPAPGSLLP